MSFEGEAVQVVRSLGGQTSASCSFASELRMRMACTNKAFCSVGRLWTTPMIPYKWKRASFICHVVNTSLSGIESFVPSTANNHKLDGILAKFGRLAMRGKACKKSTY